MPKIQAKQQCKAVENLCRLPNISERRKYAPVQRTLQQNDDNTDYQRMEA
jgi:hypothetical protein